MKLRGKQETPSVRSATAKAVDYEVTIADLAARSERRAWRIAFCATLMALILALGYFLLLPLKEKEPYLVMADAYTGTSTVAKLRWDFDADSIFSSEAINKSNVSHFVVARESFERTDIVRSRDWVTVNAMSAPDVSRAYRDLFNPRNPGNLTSRYQTNEVVRVNLLSIQLAGATSIQVGKGAIPSQAVVRFQRLLYNKDNNATSILDTDVATVQFIYRDNLDMSDRLRMQNPLGFWVTSYRVDKELDGSSVAAPGEQMESHALPPASSAMTPSETGIPSSPEVTTAHGAPPSTPESRSTEH